MKAFEFDHNLIDSYARFSRSFSTIRAPDIAAEVTRQYDDGRFWPSDEALARWKSIAEGGRAASAVTSS